jgi:hypothetical protein
MSFWYVDSFRIHPGAFYRYRVAGINGHVVAPCSCGCGTVPDARFFWRVPNLRGFVFRLQEVESCAAELPWAAGACPNVSTGRDGVCDECRDALREGEEAANGL